MKRDRECELDDIIREELAAARTEGRDFSFSVSQKSELADRFGADVVCETLIREIRSARMACIDPFRPGQDISALVARVTKDASCLDKRPSSWFYKLGHQNIVHESAVLLRPVTTAGMISTHFHGDLRYSQKMSARARSGAENWNDDAALRKIIANNLKDKKPALSRNRLRVNCLQLFGCKYATAFPVSVAVWIFKREAARRPGGVLACCIDPCAGWGDRLLGALIAGDCVTRYVGIDPWDVSREACMRACAAFPTAGNVSLLQQTAECAEPWPEADLVFTSPPYAKLECYNQGGNPQDGQAWRLVDTKAFFSAFLAPLMQKAAAATRRLRGRVIININNTPKSAGGSSLTSDLAVAAERAGLVLVETFGMTLSVRAPKTTFEHGASCLRAEPFFVFEHPK
jgi:hypothetical protein